MSEVSCSTSGVTPGNADPVTYKIRLSCTVAERTPTRLSLAGGLGAALPLKYFNRRRAARGRSPHVFLPLETTDLGHSDELLDSAQATPTRPTATPSTQARRCTHQGGDLEGTSPRATGARSTSARPSGSVG